MSDTKSLLVFIALSAVLLIGISLLPEAEPILVTETAATPTSTIVRVNQPSDLVKGGVTPAGWTIIVQKY